MRPKGIPNKSTALLEQKAKELGVDPFDILLRFAAGDWQGLGYDNECYVMENAAGATKIGYTITPEMRLKAASEACQYILPKRKAMEVTQADMIEREVMDIEQKSKLLERAEKEIELLRKEIEDGV